MESDEGKLFIGGIAWDTTEGTLRDYFTRFGDVSQVVIMRDKTTGRPRGFGFVVFSDPSVLDQVLQDKHTIDGRPVSLPTMSFEINYLFGLFNLIFSCYFLKALFFTCQLVVGCPRFLLLIEFHYLINQRLIFTGGG